MIFHTPWQSNAKRQISDKYICSYMYYIYVYVYGGIMFKYIHFCICICTCIYYICMLCWYVYYYVFIRIILLLQMFCVCLYSKTLKNVNHRKSHEKCQKAIRMKVLIFGNRFHDYNELTFSTVSYPLSTVLVFFPHLIVSERHLVCLNLKNVFTVTTLKNLWNKRVMFHSLTKGQDGGQTEFYQKRRIMEIGLWSVVQ